jgi:hypothetical protein
MNPHTSPRLPETNLKIACLRELLVSARDLGEVFDYFHDVLVPDDCFMALGIPEGDARVTAALDAVLRALAPNGRLGTPLLMHLETHGLWHGCARWGAGQVVFFYFESLDMGFCTYSASFLSDEAKFARFRLSNVRGLGLPMSTRVRGCA